MSGQMTTGGFTAGDFRLLESMRSGASRDPTLESMIEALWRKSERFTEQLGGILFGGAPFHAAVWPDPPGGERLPFIWARLKRADARRYATHLGLFLAPGGCNICIDLEKDLLEDDGAAETVEQLLAFYRNELAARVEGVRRSDAMVWTDPDNIIPATRFADADFDAFMAANRDDGHPWPRLGYLLDSAEIEAFGDRGGIETARRAATLVAVYDAMIAAYRRDT